MSQAAQAYARCCRPKHFERGLGRPPRYRRCHVKLSEVLTRASNSFCSHHTDRGSRRVTADAGVGYLTAFLIVILCLAHGIADSTEQSTQKAPSCRLRPRSASILVSTALLPPPGGPVCARWSGYARRVRAPLATLRGHRTRTWPPTSAIARALRSSRMQLCSTRFSSRDFSHIVKSMVASTGASSVTCARVTCITIRKRPSRVYVLRSNSENRLAWIMWMTHQPR